MFAVEAKRRQYYSTSECCLNTVACTFTDYLLSSVIVISIDNHMVLLQESKNPENRLLLKILGMVRGLHLKYPPKQEL